MVVVNLCLITVVELKTGAIHSIHCVQNALRLEIKETIQLFSLMSYFRIGWFSYC